MFLSRSRYVQIVSHVMTPLFWLQLIVLVFFFMLMFAIGYQTARHFMVRQQISSGVQDQKLSEEGSENLRENNFDQQHGARNYTVQANDTLWKIAGTELADNSRFLEIAKLNTLTNPDHLAVGMILKLPDATSQQTATEVTESGDKDVKNSTVSCQSDQHTVIAGDTLSAITLKYCGSAYSWPLIFQENIGTVSNPDLIYPGQVLQL